MAAELTDLIVKEESVIVKQEYITDEIDLYNIKIENQEKYLASNVQKTHIQMYYCPRCDKQLSSEGALQSHTLAYHGSKPFGCPCCDYRSSLRGIMKNHVQIRHGITLQNKDIVSDKVDKMFTLQEFICISCNVHFSNSEELQHHRLVCKDSRLIKCFYCEYISSENGTMKQHMKTRHNVDVDTLDVAPRKSASKNVSVQEQNVAVKSEPQNAETETQEKQSYLDGKRKPTCVYKCADCPNQFSSKARLQRHTQTSHGSKPFGCLHCDYRSSLRGIMKNHVQVRHGISLKSKDIVSNKMDKTYIRQFICKACHMHFSNKEELQSHLFKCLTCNYKSSGKSVMKNHKRIRHSVNVDPTDMSPTSFITIDGNEPNTEYYMDADIKMEIGATEVVSDVTVKQENDDELSNDDDLNYDINSGTFFRSNKTVDGYKECKEECITKDVFLDETVLDNCVKVEIVTNDIDFS